MTFINRLGAITPSQGSGVQNDTFYLRQAITLSGTTTQTNTLPTTGSWIPSISKGKLRVKAYAPAASGVSPAISALSFVLTDGTAFVEVMRVTSPVLAIGANTPSASQPSFEDRVQEFEVDINATSMIVVSLLTGTAPIVIADIELSGTT